MSCTSWRMKLVDLRPRPPELLEAIFARLVDGVRLRVEKTEKQMDPSQFRDSTGSNGRGYCTSLPR